LRVFAYRPERRRSALWRICQRVGKANLDAAGRHLGIFLISDELALGGADVAVRREFPPLVHRRSVAHRVIDRGLA
jgi:hypothetical protein